VNILELKKISDFFQIPFKRQDIRDEWESFQKIYVSS
jgi:hypothetical protein